MKQVKGLMTACLSHRRNLSGFSPVFFRIRSRHRSSPSLHCDGDEVRATLIEPVERRVAH
jgi:hypothetical protein